MEFVYFLSDIFYRIYGYKFPVASDDTRNTSTASQVAFHRNEPSRILTEQSVASQYKDSVFKDFTALYNSGGNLQ